MLSKKMLSKGIAAAIISFIFFFIIIYIFKATDAQGYILASTITICTTMYCCTEYFLEQLKKNK